MKNVMKIIGKVLLYILLIPFVIFYINILMPIFLLCGKLDKDDKSMAIVCGVVTLVMLVFIPFVPMVSLIILMIIVGLFAVFMVYKAITEKPETGLGKSAGLGAGNKTSGRFYGLDSISAKKLFRSLVKKYHPDNGSGDNETMKEIVQEYEAYKGNK